MLHDSILYPSEDEYVRHLLLEFYIFLGVHDEECLFNITISISTENLYFVFQTGIKKKKLHREEVILR